MPGTAVEIFEELLEQVRPFKKERTCTLSIARVPQASELFETLGVSPQRGKRIRPAGQSRRSTGLETDHRRAAIFREAQLALPREPTHGLVYHRSLER